MYFGSVMDDKILTELLKLLFRGKFEDNNHFIRDVAWFLQISFLLFFMISEILELMSDLHCLPSLKSYIDFIVFHFSLDADVSALVVLISHADQINCIFFGDEGALGGCYEDCLSTF